MSEIKPFIQKLKQIPARVQRAKVLKLGKKLLIKAAEMEDFLALMYKDMPESLRHARKNGMKSSFQSFKLLEQLDKLFISKDFINKMGFALIDMKKLEELLATICTTIENDEMKIKSILNK